MTQTPFPTVFELIRFIATSFGTKASDKQLDDLARDVFADYRQVEPVLERVVIAPLSKYVSSQFANTFSSEIQKMLADYLKLVSLKSVDGISREQVLPVLVSHWFVENALNFLKDVLTQLTNMPSASLLLGNASPAIGNILGWANDHVDDWTGSISDLPKEQRDQLSNWQKGKHLPDLQSLHLLMAIDVGQGLSQEARERVMGLLVLARAVDSLRSLPLGEAALDDARQQLMGAQPIGSLYKLFESHQQDAMLYVEPIWSNLGYLSNHLEGTIPKSQEVQSESRKCLDDLTYRLKSLREYETSKHQLEKMEGRWHVFSGDLKAACKHYAVAVEAALYRAGDELNEVLEEAFCVAAKANHSVLMRKVKNSLVLFKVDLESVNQQLVDEPSKKTDQFVQDWEVKAWTRQFERTFPNSGLFINTPDYETDLENGPILYSTDKEVKPDYRNPDRKIKIGYEAKKTWPQICWFILQGQYDVVERLIEKGARMDVESSSGDTPLIMALEKLSLVNDSSIYVAGIHGRDISDLYPSLDDRFFKLVMVAKNVQKSVNKQSHKKKLTPLLQAVESGRPEIVKAVLEMGAKVDLKGNANSQTALTVCLNRIGILDNSDRWVDTQLGQKVTPELLDAIRRHTGAVLGASLESQRIVLDDQDIQVTAVLQLMAVSQRFTAYTDREKMLQILELLLQYGANPNALAETPVKGFTPTMMAAELDLADELSVILKHGGDLTQEVKVIGKNNTEHIFNSDGIAKLFNSKKALKVMDGWVAVSH